MVVLLLEERLGIDWVGEFPVSCIAMSLQDQISVEHLGKKDRQPSYFLSLSLS